MTTETLEERDLRYLAFISYNRSDRVAAVSLQRKLERFVLPAALRLVKPGARYNARPLKSIFRDEDELVPGHDLAQKVRDALAQSKYLIVICSPASANSRWVEQEVCEFLALGDGRNVLAVVVSGNPYAQKNGFDPASECLAPALRAVEPLWIDWRTQQSESRTNFLRIVAALLSLQSLDDLIQRDTWRRRRQTIAGFAAGALLLLGTSAGAVAYTAARQDAAATRAQTLIEASGRASDDGDYERAARLALVGLKYHRTAAGEAALRRAVANDARMGLPIQTGTGAVKVVRISPDGKTIAAGTEDGRLRLYDLKTRKPLGRELRFKDAVTDETFSSSGRLLAGATQNVLSVMNVATGAAIAVQKIGKDANFDAVAVSPDESMIAASDGYGTMRIWRRSTDGYALSSVTIDPKGTYVAHLEFSADSKQLIVIDQIGTLTRWNPLDGKVMGKLQLQTSTTVSCAAFSPRQDTIVTGLCNGLLEVWNAATGIQIGSPLVAHNGQVTALAFSADGRFFASGGVDRRVRLWPARQGPSFTPSPALLGHNADITALAFAPSGEMLVSGASDGELRVWNVTAAVSAPPAPFSEHAAPAPDAGPPAARPVQLSANGYVVTYEPSQAARLTVAAQTGGRPALLSQGRPLAARGQALALSPQGTSAIALFADGTLVQWRTRDGIALASTRLNSSFRYAHMAISQDGRAIVIVDRSGHLDVWRPHERQLVRTAIPGAGAEKVEISNGGVVVLAFADGSIRAWNGEATVGPIAPPDRPASDGIFGQSVRWMILSGDGTRLASWYDNGMFRIWNIKDGGNVAGFTAEPIDSTFSDASFSPDSRFLVLRTLDWLDLWDAQLGTVIARYRSNAIYQTENARFVSDGSVIAVTGESLNGTQTRLWNIAPLLLTGTALSDYACSHLLAGGLSRIRDDEFATEAALDRTGDTDACAENPQQLAVAR
ncbi:MAG TPA: TIR domain-containing protein [Rhizomicrobium sp.]|jgi:WD40 repeat protein|nr:TIR domain-containing protein [Rhizomicrobium sp.]